MTGKNPIEVNFLILIFKKKVLVNAVKMGGAREDSTRIGTGGTVRK